MYNERDKNFSDVYYDTTPLKFDVVELLQVIKPTYIIFLYM